MALNQFLAERDPNARELFYDPGTNIDEGTEIGAIGGHSDHVHYVPSGDVNGQRAVGTAKAVSKSEAEESRRQNDEVVGAINNLDAEQTKNAQIIIAEGKRRGASDEDIISALEAGLVESDLRNLDWGDRDSQGVFQQRPSQGWGEPGSVAEDARQFFDALEESGGGSPGQRAQSVQRSAFPEKYDQRQEEAIGILESLEGTSISALDLDSDSADDSKAMLQELRANNAGLDEAIRVAQDPSSSDAQVIQALQTISDTVATTEDEGVKSELEGVQSAIMEDRGIKEYDPFEGATDDLFGTVLGIAQTVVGLYNTIENGLKNAKDTFALLSRGISNTKELNQLVDGFQSIAETIGSVMSTVGNLISSVASIAALAGAAIPGVNVVTGAISAITGGIANVNAVVDLVQEVMRIGGRFVGGFLSMIAGGANGPLYGNIKTLLDTNDGTIKTWSDRNPNEKTVHGGPGRDPNKAGGIENLNVYQGQGGSAADSMNAAMFAVKAHSTGVFSG